MNINATILGQAFAFIIFVGICMKYVWPPIISAIEKRQKEIIDGLAYADRAKKDLDLAQANATDQIKKAKVQAQILIDQANKQSAQIIDQAKREAEVERNKIVAQARNEIDVERKRAREELRKQVAMLAVAGAEKIIGHSLDEAANSDIVDKLVAEL